MRLARALICLWFGLFVVAAYSAEHDLITSRALFVEPLPGALSIQEAVKQDYKPFSGVLNRSFVPTIRWVRVLVKPPASGAEQIVLRVGPHYISQIELFEEQNGSWSRRVAGDRYPAGQNACADNLYCFPVKVQSGIENYFYFRIESVNGFFLTTRAMEPGQLSRFVVGQQRLFGVETGVTLALCIWALLVYFRTRHKLVGFFFATQVVSLIFTISTSGLLAELYFKNHVWLDNLVFNTLYVLRLITSLLLTQALLDHYSPPKWYSYYIKSTLAILFLQLVALKFNHLTLLALNFNLLLVTLMPVILLIALSACRQMPKAHRNLIAAGLLMMCGLLWVDIVPFFGWIQPDLVAAPGNWGGLIVAIIMSMMVVSDITHRRVIYDREMQELQFMRARNLVETEQIKERSMLIDMLTHELKNPLATMRMAAGSLKRSLSKLDSIQSADSTDRIDSMVQAIGNMNTVIERCVQVDQLDQKGFSPKFEDIRVDELVQTIMSRSNEAERIDVSVQPKLLIRTDPNLLAIILSNLLDNAVKYSQNDSRITLEFFQNRVEQDQMSRYTLRVSNFVGAEGAPDPDVLFNRYYRGPYAHEKSGTGLGLYLVKSLCKILGGTVRYEYKDGQVIFTVDLKR